MPNLKLKTARFEELMGKKYTFEELEKLGFEFGVEIEQDENADQETLKFDCMNNRPDLLTEATLTRAFKLYLELMETPSMKLSKPLHQIVVEPSVNEVRPIVAGAILRGIKFSELTYRAFIDAQEKLHETFCRSRKYASIGTHDLDKIKGPFTYKALPPADFKFIPLNQEAEVDGHGMMESLKDHKLKKYLPLIKDSPAYPLITDSSGQVLSVPPIINSEYSKISVGSQNVFIEITALDTNKAMTCLNTLIWSFSEYCQVPYEIEPVEIVVGGKTSITPNLDAAYFDVSHSKAEQLVGAPLSQQQILKYLKRSGLSGVASEDGQTYKVAIPAWRPDVLHEVDILEDIAICYGYTKIVPVFPSTSTFGSRIPFNKFTDLLRREVAQAQFLQVLNFALCSKADMTTNIFNADDSKLITVQGSKTKEFETGRATLLPGLLKTFLQNKSQPLPFRLYEVGECIQLDDSTDTGAKNIRKMAAAITDQIIEGSKKDLYSVVHGLLDHVMKKSGHQFLKDYNLEASTDQFYFPGQRFNIFLKGAKVGTLGVVNPRVLTKFGWHHPVAMWQIELRPLATNFFSK